MVSTLSILLEVELISLFTRPSYDNDMSALADAIDIAANQHQVAFKALVVKYKQDFSSKSGQVEFEEFIRKIIPVVDKMLSPKYKSNCLSRYYSEYGVVSTIHNALKKIFMEKYEDIASTF